jgi:hypothetical protein
MAELKKTPIRSVNEDIISMEFDVNPNIPTANYSNETAERIQQAIVKKLRAEKLKKMIESELKQDTKVLDGESLGFSFTFNSM